MFLHKLQTGVGALIALAGILLAGGLAVGLRAQAGPGAERPNATDKPAAGAPRAVTVVHPVRRQAAPSEEFTGRLEARRSVEVRPAVSAFCTKVCFKAGDEVKMADVLFELDSRPARAALDKAEAELTLAEAKKKLSDADLKRARNLMAASRIAADDFDKVQERAATAEAAVKTARIAVERARLDLEATKVRAPMSGRVGRPRVEPGTLVFRGPDRATLLTTITALDPIGLVFDVDERSFLHYQRLLRGQKVRGAGASLRVQLADEKGFPHEGTLEGFGDRVRPETGTVRGRGSLANPGRRLLPGMFARVRLTFGKPRAVLVVPEGAVLTDQGKHYVFVVGKGNVVERRAVTRGQADDGRRVIDKGLGAEDWVVVAGPAGLRPGDRIEPRKRAAPKR